MSKKLYSTFLLLFLFAAGASAQLCDNFSATAETFESRCAATGKIIITAVNGSGTYNYAVTVPVSTPYTSINIIDGLPAGVYQVFVKDVINNCFFSIPIVTVDGSYRDPRFELVKTDVTCFNGNNGTITVDSVQFGRAPFSYTIVAPSTYGIGTTSATGVFTNLVSGSYYIQQRDSCGGIQTRNISILNYNWFIDVYTVNRIACDSADIFIGLKDIYGNINTSGSVFDGYTYGFVTPAGDTSFFTTYNFRILLGNNRSLTLFAKDKCGNIKKVIWIDNKKPVVASVINQLNQTCNYFSAQITGQQNLTEPSYCLYDSLNNLIGCNTSGQFDSLAYGSYCIRITDVCYDTVINRCFTAIKPIPSVAASVTVTYGDDCNIVTVSISGQTNLFNPQFCLYDSLDVLISCNTTGNFSNVPVGRYCMKITGSICDDTTLIRCFTVVPLPVGPGTGPEFSNFSCNTFTGTIVGTSGLGNATYCLYNSANILIGCNTTGVFDSLAFGSYCMTIDVSRLTGGCADTVLTRCFTVNKPVPEVGDVEITKTCSLFKAKISSTQNIFNPVFCLYKDKNLVGCNTTGVFDSLAFGNYCIAVKDSCTDSTILKCFDVMPDTLEIRANAKPSCSLDQTKITVTVETGIAPYHAEIFDPLGNSLSIIITDNHQIVFDSLPNLASKEEYRIVIRDSCGNRTTIFIEPIVSFFTKTKALTRNCPGGSYTEGSYDVELTLTSNLAKVFPVIIKKNGSSVNISYSFSNTAQTVFTFKNLEPAVYIIRSTVNNSCNLRVYDTITVASYQYPTLQNSNLYRCDDNSFTVSAVTAGGIGPNLYEIIGSVPSFPSIVSAPQLSPLFTINNGNAYTLVRLRVLDACGNASINDISLVPLVNIVVTAQGGCMSGDVTMKVDSVPGAVYSWYRKISDADSMLIGSNGSYYIPYITPADTGMYLCKVTLNNSCITRVSYFRLTGFCNIILNSSNIILQGKKQDNDVLINWKVINESGLEKYIVERKRSYENKFTPINTQPVSLLDGYYKFIDQNPAYGIHEYRIRVAKQSGGYYFSDVITVKNKTGENDIVTFPNPANNTLTVQLSNTVKSEIVWKLSDLNGKVLTENKLFVLPQQNFVVLRPPNLSGGLYLLSVTNLATNTTEIKKVIFK